MNDNDDLILEKNVSSLLDQSGDAPRMTDLSRARVRAKLLADFGKDRKRSPYVAVGAGLAAVAAAAAIVALVGSKPKPEPDDGPVLSINGATYIPDQGAKLTVVADRHVRVEGAVLLDVEPGKGPFTVETARGRIEVLGTRFLVDGEPDKTTTAVVRGQVKLVSDQGDVLLHAGEQGVVELGRPPVRMPAPRLSHLVSWAQQARHKMEHGSEPVRHGTLYAREPNRPWVEESPLPIANLSVDVVVEDRVARVALDQTFHNPAPMDMEGMYRFAIPPDAALQRLAMYVDGKLTESAVVERMAARRIYEEQVYRRVDPALLEWAGTGKLQLRVYPLPARQDKRLMVAYTQSLPKLYEDWTLTIPLPDVDQPVGKFDVSMKIAGCANCELSSASHKLDVTRSGNDAVVHLEQTGAKIGDSIVLHVRDTRKDATIATETADGDHYVLVRAPGDVTGKPTAYKSRTWVILDDVSASRDALARTAQADMIDGFLRELDEQDKVAILAFDVGVRQKLAPTRVMDVDRHAIRDALKSDGGVGATDFGTALDAAMKLSPDVVVYLGDGVISAGTRHLDELRAKMIGKAQFIGVGVGDGPDTQTLDALAAATGGYATTIDLSDDLGWRAFDLVAALHTARVTGLDAHLVDAQGKLVPATLYPRSAQLADGEELEIVAKLAGSGTPVAVEVSGTRDGETWHQRIALDRAHDGAKYLPRLWAQRHIAARLLEKQEPVTAPPCVPSKTAACLSESELRDQRDEVIRKDIITLGKKYFLLSRHTSLLVLENDAMYAQYGITKGSGDTWAPYAMPAKIEVKVAPAMAVIPENIADDAVLVRAPLPVFYDYGPYYAPSGRISAIRGAEDSGWITTRSSALAKDALDEGGVEGGFAPTLPAETKQAKADTDANKPQDIEVDGKLVEAQKAGEVSTRDLSEVELGRSGLGWAGGGKSTGTGFGYGVGYGGHGRYSRRAAYAIDAPVALQRFMYASDVAYDDLSALMPALFPDGADAWRKRFGGSGKANPIDDAARALLAKARAALPSGVYRWGDFELALDDARRIGWHRTTEAGLVETAAIAHGAWTRRYSELGIDATRAIGNDDVALSLAYLPVLVADPDHYAAYFTVRAKGNKVELVRDNKLALSLAFDDAARLTSVSDKDGHELIAITWSSVGPTGARIDGDKVSVSYTAAAVADATTWGLTGDPGTLVELPSRVPTYWSAKADKESAGSQAWRHAERQLMVSYAALGNRGELAKVYLALLAHGGVELGDLAIASGGVAGGMTDADFTSAIKPLASTLVGRYLTAGRTYGQHPRPDAMIPATHDGAIGALWTLRQVMADLADGRHKPAVEHLLSIPSLETRYMGTVALSQYAVDPTLQQKAWDSVALGEYKNIARAQEAQALYNVGSYEAAADAYVQLVAELDLDARPPAMQMAPYSFQVSRRGQAGWQLAWAQWRDKVLAGDSFEHVMSLMPVVQHYSTDVQRVLARGLELAGDDIDRVVTVSELAFSYGETAWAQTMLEPLAKRAENRELLQLVGNLALQQGRHADALRYFERAEDAGSDERVGLTQLRAELGQILTVARDVAVESTGKARDSAVADAMRWGDRWRAIDPGNATVDQMLGELQLAVGNKDEAWRQLSSVIERDPMSGDGYQTVANEFEQQGRVAEALDFWEQAIRIDQTNPTPRMRKAQALIALGRSKEGDAVLKEIASRKWHEKWAGVVYQVDDLLRRGTNQR